jgi:hypothetical protein
MYYFVAVRVSVWETNERDSNIGSRHQDRPQNRSSEAISQESLNFDTIIVYKFGIDTLMVITMSSKVFWVLAQCS